MMKLFYDLETTGTDYKKHSIHQISGWVEVDNVVVEKFDFKVRPHPKARIEPEAMTVCKVTIEQIMKYPDMETMLKKLKKLLSKYVDRYDPKDKIYLVGFNNKDFDDRFLRKWFELCGDFFIGSWFWSHTLDVSCLASEYLLNRRPNMSSFKLKRVALELGIVVDKSKLHDASYDVYLTREIYRIVTGREIEL